MVGSSDGNASRLHLVGSRVARCAADLHYYSSAVLSVVRRAKRSQETDGHLTDSCTNHLTTSKFGFREF